MQRTHPPLFVFVAIFVVFAFVGYALRVMPTVIGHAMGVLEADYDETPGEALARIVEGKKVINVHEHIEDITTVPRVLAAMDRYGMKKTILMGSSWFTITLNEKVGFTRYDENNDSLLEIVARYPGRFEAWPTINPLDPQKLEKAMRLHERGATGIKLYLGHGYERRDTGQYMFHTVAMDDREMFPLYEFWERENVPLCFHVNPFKDGFAEEFFEVLANFPDLKVIAPHFILSSIKSSRLEEYFDIFPNLYSDISFGHDSFLGDGLKRISKNPEKFKRLFRKYPNRFMFGSDLVMTNIPIKTVDWFSVRVEAYYDMLTKSEYTTPVVPGVTLRGLELRGPLLDNILYRNFEAFKASDPEGTRITRELDWTKMGVKKLPRQPGQALPPKGQMGSGLTLQHFETGRY